VRPRERCQAPYIRPGPSGAPVRRVEPLPSQRVRFPVRGRKLKSTPPHDYRVLLRRRCAIGPNQLAAPIMALQYPHSIVVSLPVVSAPGCARVALHVSRAGIITQRSRRVKGLIGRSLSPPTTERKR
jgi:hypothetical protein